MIDNTNYLVLGLGGSWILQVEAGGTWTVWKLHGCLVSSQAAAVGSLRPGSRPRRLPAICHFGYIFLAYSQ